MLSTGIEMQNIKNKVSDSKVIAAVVAEYNPFHNGHFHHIAETKRICNADYVIAIMSGDFVQRGEPAILNKYDRANMALLNGVDLVIELPVYYALSCAEIFAKGAVSILNNLNSINYLSFGSESGNIKSLYSCANELISNSSQLNNSITKYISDGNSYPKAYEIASAEFISKPDLLKNPNNLLSLEYIKALIELNSDIEPITVKRTDSGYNSLLLDEASKYASASSLRECLKNNNNKYLQYIPKNTNSFFDNKTANIDDYSDLMYYRLLSFEGKSFCDFLDVNDDLSHKITKNIRNFNSFSSFVSILKSKNITEARIKRALFHILFDIKKTDINYNNQYVRVLGFKESSKELLGILKRNSSIPLISKLSDAKRTASLNTDIYCSNIYEQLQKSGINELTMSPIILH